MSEFSKNKTHKDGLQSQCKTCVKLYKSQLSYKPITIGTKICNICGKEKPVSEFYGNRTLKDGLRTQCKICDALYYKEHREEILPKMVVYNDKHKEKITLYLINYRAKHQKEQAASVARWRKANPDKDRAIRQRYRAKKRGNGGTHTATDIQYQGELQNWMCYWQGPGCEGYCKDKYHVDHVIPLDRGGSNNPSNIVISCPHCNLSKNNKLPEEWIATWFIYW